MLTFTQQVGIIVICILAAYSFTFYEWKKQKNKYLNDDNYYPGKFSHNYNHFDSWSKGDFIIIPIFMGILAYVLVLAFYAVYYYSHIIMKAS